MKKPLASQSPETTLYGRAIGVLGLISLSAAVLLFLIEPLWTRYNSILLIVGCVFIVRFVLINRRVLAAERRNKIRVNVTAMVILALVLWGMTNYLASRRYSRKDWTATRQYQLAEFSKNLVGNLSQSLQVTTIFKPGTLNQRVQDLLKEYQSESRHFLVTQLEPDKEPGKVQILTDRLGLMQLQNSSLVLEYGDRFRVIRRSDLITYETIQPRPGAQPRRQAWFNGETAVTFAVMELLYGEKLNVYFTVGHGEKSPDAYDKNGLSSLRDALRRENFIVRSVFLLQTETVPDDCDLLVIAGPQRPFSTVEVQAIDAYLHSGGKLLVLVDPLQHSGLESLLQNWGVRLNDDVVVDLDQKGSTRDPFSLHIHNYQNHPITENLFKTASFFPTARSLELHQVAGKQLVMDYLLYTSKRSWGERRPRLQPVNYSPGIDIKGPLYLAAAVAEAPSLYSADVQQKRTHLVVFGDSDFVSNAHINKIGNQDLVLNSISWLTLRDQMMGIRAKAPDVRRLVLSAGQKKAIFWVSLTVLPFLGILTGTAVWWRRRR